MMLPIALVQFLLLTPLIDAASSDKYNRRIHARAAKSNSTSSTSTTTTLPALTTAGIGAVTLGFWRVLLTPQCLSGSCYQQQLEEIIKGNGTETELADLKPVPGGSGSTSTSSVGLKSGSSTSSTSNKAEATTKAKDTPAAKEVKSTKAAEPTAKDIEIKTSKAHVTTTAKEHIATQDLDEKRPKQTTREEIRIKPTTTIVAVVKPTPPKVAVSSTTTEPKETTTKTTTTKVEAETTHKAETTTTTKVEAETTHKAETTTTTKVEVETTTHKVETTTTTKAVETIAPSTSDSASVFESQALKAHNDFRALYGAAPLKWSNDLAAKAQSWSDRCVFEHSHGALGPLGENIAAGQSTIVEAINDWEAEAPTYNPSNPQASHFTQVVWKASTELGCSVTNCGDHLQDAGGVTGLFFVCEYSPAGNVFPAENFLENVGALQG